MSFTKIHGATFADNSWVENIHFERLATDPAVTEAGRIWYNTTGKVFKMSTLDAGGSVIIRKFLTVQELLDFKASLAATTVDASGTTLVGYDGQSGSNGKFSVTAGSLDSALDTIVTKIDDIQEDLDSAESNSAAIQVELDATQAGAGLDVNGAYIAFEGTNHLDAATSLKNADFLLDNAVAANTSTIAQEISDRIANDNLKLDKAGGTMTGGINMSSNSISGLAEPVDPQDAATKNYVDTVAQGLDVKESCRVASTGNIDTATGGLLTIDGVVVVDGDRVLVKNQTDATENGIYIAASGAWSRSTDFDGDPASEVTPGAFTFVEEGDTNHDCGFVIVTDGEITLGTTEIGWEQFSGVGQVIAGAGLQKSGNELFVNMGAGIVELPSDEVGIDVHPTGGLFTTSDGDTPSTETGAQLSIKRDGTTISITGSGIRVNQSILDSITSAQNELDAAELGAGLETNGTYAANIGANYIAAATSLKVADNLLDAAVKVNADAIAQEITDRQTAVSNVQTELDATQVGAGLSVTGGYVASAGANYISGATSLHNASILLDNAINGVQTSLTNEITNRQTADQSIQSELDATQTGAGLASDGDYNAATSANYIAGATSIHNATVLLDSQLKGVADDLAQEISDRNAAVVNLRNTINAKVFKNDYVSALTHSVVHSLATSNVEVMVWVKDDDGKWKNDLVGIIVEDNNTITVELTESREIRCIVRSAEALA